MTAFPSGKAVRAAKPRARYRFALALGLLAIVAIAGALYVLQPWAMHPRPVSTLTLVPGPASRVLAVNGRVAAVTDVQLGSTVSGQVTAVNVHEGDRVTAGQVLATLDDSQQRSATAQAEAALAASEAEAQQAQSQYDRSLGLGMSISQKDLQSAKVALQTANNDVQRLTAALNEARNLLGAYTIRAPFAGTVLARGIDPGQVVSSSTVLFEIADLTHLEVDVTVDELYAGDIHRGLDARLRPAGSSGTFESEVSFIAPTVDSATGGRLVRIALPAGQGRNLPIGLTVDTNIVVDHRENAITVPRAAVLDPRTAPAVLLVKDGRAERTPIDFIDWPAGDLIVTHGLSGGDVVITDPAGVPLGEPVVQRAR